MGVHADSGCMIPQKVVIEVYIYEWMCSQVERFSVGRISSVYIYVIIFIFRPDQEQLRKIQLYMQ
jgi:hypothetical protein